MAGSSREPGPTARLVAANLRRIRREHGLGYAELARRLAAIGHPVADTALMKTEGGTRRASVDDLAALAVALNVTPNRLLLPDTDDAPPDDDESAPWGKEPPAALWRWATGEAPLGRAPVTAADDRPARNAEVGFSRDNRQQHWTSPAAPPLMAGDAAARRALAATSLDMFTQAAFAAGLSTADIRSVVEAALAAALLSPAPAGAVPRVEAGDGKVTLYLDPRDSPGDREGD